MRGLITGDPITADLITPDLITADLITAGLIPRGVTTAGLFIGGLFIGEMVDQTPTSRNHDCLRHKGITSASNHAEKAAIAESSGPYNANTSRT